MGNKQQNYLNDLSLHGRGAFGKVWKVILKKYEIDYALKEMSKKKIIDRKSEGLIMYERDLLVRMNHPFLSNLKFSFQDEDKLYLVMDLLTGGDLRYHLYKHKTFTESQTKFFVACVILALEYLHKNKIIHHDLKPENLLLDDKGYVKLTDFGIARIYRENNSDDMSGSPGYIAPEILIEENHSYSADYFSLGVIVYEFMKGVRPYSGRSRRELRENMLNKEINLTKGDLPPNWSSEAADFITQLLKLNQKQRLGYNGVEEIKGHPWLKYYNWKNLYLEKIKAPFIPSENLADNYNVKYCNMVEKIGVNTQERYKKISKNEYYPIMFTRFAYFNRYALEAKGKKENSKFTNPHMIYELLEEKEQTAFNPESVFENKHSRNKTSGLPKRAVSMGDSSRFRGIMSSSESVEVNHKGDKTSRTRNNGFVDENRNNIHLQKNSLEDTNEREHKKHRKKIRSLASIRDLIKKH